MLFLEFSSRLHLAIQWRRMENSTWKLKNSSLVLQLPRSLQVKLGYKFTHSFVQNKIFLNTLEVILLC